MKEGRETRDPRSEREIWSREVDERFVGSATVRGGNAVVDVMVSMQVDTTVNRPLAL